MRIRTVKPTFWTNEKMSVLPDFTRLVALALLNYADDSGYFWANPKMIRGALFPFEEDSKRILGTLAQLSDEGYLRLGKTADGRDVGHIISFRKHQRIDKPTDSEIEQLASFEEASKNTQRVLQDSSCLDRKGREEERKGAAAVAPPPVFPFESDAFKTAWDGWLDYRKTRKLKYTNQGIFSQFKQFKKWGEAAAISAIEASIRNNWQGLFEPKPGDVAKNSTSDFDRAYAESLAALKQFQSPLPISTPVYNARQ